MRVRFWGTRGSIARAGPATLRYGGNTSCVEVRTDAGDLLVVDCGTGIHVLGHALVSEHPEGPINGHLLVTHTHWDHIQGFPFFRPLFRPGSTWHVYGPRGLGGSLRESLGGQMQYTYFPVSIEQLEARVHFHDLVEGSLEIGSARVTAHYLNHPALTLGYRIEADNAAVVYASDHEPHSRALAAGGTPADSIEDARHVAFLSLADLVIHDAQYRASEYAQKVGWGHSTIEYAVDCALAAEARSLALYHHDPMRDDAAVDENVALARDRVAAAGAEMAVFAADEGREIVLENAEPWRPAVARPPAAAHAAPAMEHMRRAVLVAAADGEVGVLRDAAAADGMEVLTADSLDSAIELVTDHHPALIIAARDLSGGGAERLCARVRALPVGYGRQVPVIAIASGEADRPRGDAVGAGVTDWLTRPFTVQYARTRMRAWLLRQACRWQPAMTAPDEERRLAALERLRVLDTPIEDRFDRYTRLASAMFDVPIALLSFVDAKRQWFKSRHGIDLDETPRDLSFCAHAILGEDVMQVCDTLDDERFADNPLVTGAPRVRFYAGMPISAPGGERVGTLCIIDHRPRELRPSELSNLRDLARMVEKELAG